MVLKEDEVEDEEDEDEEDEEEYLHREDEEDEEEHLHHARGGVLQSGVQQSSSLRHVDEMGEVVEGRRKLCRDFHIRLLRVWFGDGGKGKIGSPHGGGLLSTKFGLV